MRLITLSVLVASSISFAQFRPGTSGVYHSGAVVPPSGAITARNASPRPGPRQWAIPPAMPHPQHGRTTVVYYPVFYGGNYYGYDPSTSAPAPAYDAAPSDSPVVVMTQSYRRDILPPVARDYSEPTMKVYDAAAEQPLVYLIAMKDHTIFPAVAYWVEGETLSYVTTEGSPNRASLDLVDREFSKQLNDERHIEFKLPVVK